MIFDPDWALYLQKRLRLCRLSLGKFAFVRIARAWTDKVILPGVVLKTVKEFFVFDCGNVPE